MQETLLSMKRKKGLIIGLLVSMSVFIPLMVKWFLLHVHVGVPQPVFQSEQVLAIESEYLTETDSVMVYLPNSYADENKNYPVVYMLSGYSWNHRTFGELFNMDSLATTHEMILICPDGLYDSWYFNPPSDTTDHFESFFFHDLLPEVESRYRIDTNYRFITGVSMGGHGAFYYFLRHPDRFRNAGSSSGVLNLKYSRTRDKILSDLLGPFPDSSHVFEQYSCTGQLGKKDLQQKVLYFDMGTEDYLLPSNHLFQEMCDSLDIQYEFHTYRGSHHPQFWKHSIPEHLSWFEQQVRK